MASPEPAEIEQQERRDTLTIRRCLLLTAGLAVGLGVFVPPEQSGGLFEPDLNEVLSIYNAVLIGLGLPAPLFVVGQRWRQGPPIGPGGLFASTMGLGGLLMLPPVLMARFQQGTGTATVCLYYMLPLISLWYLLAAAIAGKLGRSLFSRSTAWTERYGFFLAASWTPVGAWWLMNFYREAFR